MKRPSLTKFIAREMLYDFVTGRLSEERAKDLEEFIKSDAETAEEVRRIERAIAFTRELAKTEAPPHWVDRWMKLPPALSQRFSKWESRFFQEFWVAMPYLVVIAALGLGVYLTQPWRFARADKEVVVWNLKDQKGNLLENTVVAPPKAAASASAKTPAPNKTVTVTKPAAAKTTAPAPSPTPVTKVAKDEPPPLAKHPTDADVKRDEDMPSGAESTGKSSDKGGVAHEKSKDHKKPELKGKLYRAYLKVSDFENASVMIRDRIVQLGGERAGHVELGWRRKKDESYYHFSLPKSNYDELTRFLQSFGPVQITVHKHPVVMPPGIIRIILSVKDKGDHENSPKAP